MSNIVERIRMNAKKDLKTVVLAEGEDERDEKTHGTDKAELTDRYMFGVFHDSDNRIDGPVKVQEAKQVRQVVRGKVAESDRNRNRS